jgi:hypothetical protein
MSDVEIRLTFDRRERTWWERLRSLRPWIKYEAMGLHITSGTFHFDNGAWEYTPAPRPPIEYDGPPYILEHRAELEA